MGGEGGKAGPGVSLCHFLPRLRYYFMAGSADFVTPESYLPEKKRECRKT